jgi:hypothetical protein
LPTITPTITNTPTNTPTTTGTQAPSPTPTSTPTPTNTPTSTKTYTPTPDLAWKIGPNVSQKETTYYKITIRAPRVEPQSSSMAWVNNQVGALLGAEKNSFEQSHADTSSLDPLIPGYLNISYSATSATNFNSSADPYGGKSQTTNLDAEQAIMDAGHLVLSYIFYVDFFHSGSAHPNIHFKSITFDLKTKRALELPDLFKSGVDYLGVISDACIDDLEERGMPVSRDHSALTPNPDNYKVWNLTPNGLLLSFDQCVVLSCADGSVRSLIFYSDLANILDPNGPLGEYAR